MRGFCDSYSFQLSQVVRIVYFRILWLSPLSVLQGVFQFRRNCYPTLKQFLCVCTCVQCIYDAINGCVCMQYVSMHIRVCIYVCACGDQQLTSDVFLNHSYKDSNWAWNSFMWLDWLTSELQGSAHLCLPNLPLQELQISHCNWFLCGFCIYA